MPVIALASDATSAGSGAPLAWATVAGVALGVAYAASPLTLWALAAIIGLFVWAGCGLTARERRWVWGLLAAAVALRLLTVAALFLASDPHQVTSFFWDGDGVYLKQRALWIRNVWLGVPVPQDYFEEAFARIYGWTAYLYVLAYLQYWLGEAPYATHVFNIALFLAAVILLYRMVRSAYGRPSALLGLGLLLFLPTPFLWSVAAMKESLALLIAATAVVATVALGRADGIVKRVVALLLLAGSVTSSSAVRVGGTLVLSLGAGVGVAGSVILRRISLVVLSLTLVPYAGYRMLGHADVQARMMSQLGTFAVQHLGHVRTEGNHYKLLDPQLYSEPTKETADNMTPGEGLRFVVRALVSLVIVPLPWQVKSASELVFLLQQVVWYMLVVLAAIGIVAGMRRDPLVTCLLLGVTAAGGAVIALSSGNVGTMVRHRDTIVPFVVWLSALGAVATASAWMSRATSAQPSSQ